MSVIILWISRGRVAHLLGMRKGARATAINGQQRCVVFNAISGWVFYTGMMNKFGEYRYRVAHYSLIRLAPEF